MKVTLVLYVYNSMGGFREVAARNPSRASARTAGSRTRCVRSASPQDACTCTRQHTTPQTASPTHQHKLQQPNTTQGGRAGTRRTAMPSKGFAPTQQDCRRATDLQFSVSFQKEDRIGLPSSDPETPPHPIRMLPHPIQSEASRCWNTLERRNPSSSNTGSGQ